MKFDMEDNIFRKRLIKLMEEMGLSQRELGVKADLSHVSINRYIREERMPTGEAIVKLARALNTTPNYLLGLDGKRWQSYEPIVSEIIPNMFDLKILPHDKCKNCPYFEPKKELVPYQLCGDIWCKYEISCIHLDSCHRAFEMKGTE